MKLVFLDTETTGLDDPRIVQLAYKLYDDSQTHKSIPYNRYYKPPKPIEIGAIQTHGITNEAVQDLLPFVPGDIQDVVNSHVIVAHNANFDIKVLKLEGVEVPKWYVCTMKCARYYVKNLENYKLATLYENFIGEVDYKEHDAFGDVEAMQQVFFHLFDEVLLGRMWHEMKVEELNDLKRKVLTEMINVSINPLLYERMPFGKYFGKSFEYIAKNDKDYLKFLKFKMGADLEGDLLYTINYYLG